MKGFYIEELNKSFVTTNKSGSLLILNSFFEFCKHKKMKCIMLDDCYDNIKNSAEFNIFVRNPIDRCITTFYWFLKKHEESNEIFGNKSIEELFTINNFNYFIENYFDIIKKTKYDFHITPQKFHILETHKDDIILDQKITDLIIKEKYPNYNIIRIEEFEEEMSKVILDAHNSFLWDIRDMENEYLNNLDIKVPVIKDMVLDDIKLLYSCFLLSQKYLNTRHHNKQFLKLNRETQNIVYKLFNDEIELYGYQKIKSLL
jgi:hypothetical protein